MGAPLNNVTAPDSYDDTATLLCPGTVLLRFWVNNQAIYWRRGVQGQGGAGIQWRPEEEFVLPGIHEFPDPCDALTIRAAIPAASLAEGKIPAQVTIATRTKAELGQ